MYVLLKKTNGSKVSLGHTMRKRIFGHLRTAKASAQSDRDLLCQLSESFGLRNVRMEGKCTLRMYMVI